MVTVEIDGAPVEIPRLVKKLGGGHLRVETEQELRDALADGWLLRLPAGSAVTSQDENGPMGDPWPGPDPGPAEGSEDGSQDEDEDAEPVEDAAPPKRKPGRPRKHG
jgi:hypothetical protein